MSDSQTQKNHLVAAVRDAEVQYVDLTRQQARDLMDVDFPGPRAGVRFPVDEFEAALDEAQGRADDDGVTSYVVVRIRGARL